MNQQQQTQFEALKSQFQKETGLDAKSNLSVYLEYIKTISLNSQVSLLAQIHNRLSEIKSIYEQRR